MADAKLARNKVGKAASLDLCRSRRIVRLAEFDGIVDFLERFNFEFASKTLKFLTNGENRQAKTRLARNKVSGRGNSSWSPSHAQRQSDRNETWAGSAGLRATRPWNDPAPVNHPCEPVNLNPTDGSTILFNSQQDNIMYTQGWELNDAQFNMGLSDTAYFECPTYDEALSRLLFIIEHQKHCGVLFGPPGAGKSMLLERLIHIVRRSQRELAVVDAHGRSERDFLWEMCGVLGMAPQYEDSSFILWRRVLDQLQAARGFELPAVLVIDHADQGGENCGGLIPRLIHLAQSGRNITLILAMRARHVIELPESAREASDIRVELGWLNRRQSGQFVRALYDSVGDSAPHFQEPAIDRLFQLSQGSPRLLSQLSELSLLAAISDEQETVTAELIDIAANDLQFGGTEGSAYRYAATTRKPEPHPQQ